MERILWTGVTAMSAWSAGCFTRVGGAEVVVACVVDPWWRRRRRCVVPLAGWLAAGCWLAEAPATKGNVARSSKQASSAGREAEAQAQAHTEEQPAVVLDRRRQYKAT